MADETLYDRLGGEEAIGAVVDDFYDRVLADDQLAPYFETTDVADLRDHQTEFISAVTGGPVDYDGASMRAAHAHLDLTESDFGAVATHLDDALADAGVDDDDRQAVMSAVAELKGEILAGD